MSNKVCQRICIDDLCRGNRENTLCGGTFCESCGKAICFDEFICEACEYVAEDDPDYCDDCGRHWAQCSCGNMN